MDEVTGRKDYLTALKEAWIHTRIINLVLKSPNKPVKHLTGNGCTMRSYWVVVCLLSDSVLECEFSVMGICVSHFLYVVLWLAIFAFPGLQLRKHHAANIPDAKGEGSNSNPDSNLCIIRSVRVYISFNMVKHNT